MGGLPCHLLNIGGVTAMIARTSTIQSLLGIDYPAPCRESGLIDGAGCAIEISLRIVGQTFFGPLPLDEITAR